MKETIFTLFLLVVVVALVFAVFGWISYEQTPGKATIEIKTHEVERAADRAGEKSRELFEEAKRGVKQMVDGSVTEQPPPAHEPVPQTP